MLKATKPLARIWTPRKRIDMCENVTCNTGICVLKPSATHIGILLVYDMVNESFELVFMLDPMGSQLSLATRAYFGGCFTL